MLLIGQVIDHDRRGRQEQGTFLSRISCRPVYNTSRIELRCQRRTRWHDESVLLEYVLSQNKTSTATCVSLQNAGSAGDEALGVRIGAFPQIEHRFNGLVQVAVGRRGDTVSACPVEDVAFEACGAPVLDVPVVHHPVRRLGSSWSRASGCDINRTPYLP